jgi:hypothetical protein
MKTVVVALMLLATTASAERLNLPFTRIRENLYRVDTTNVYVRTVNCKANLWRQRAILSFVPEAKDGDTMIMKDGSSCRVVSVYEWRMPQRRPE